MPCQVGETGLIREEAEIHAMVSRVEVRYHLSMSSVHLPAALYSGTCQNITPNLSQFQDDLIQCLVNFCQQLRYSTLCPPTSPSPLWSLPFPQVIAQLEATLLGDPARLLKGDHNRGWGREMQDLSRGLQVTLLATTDLWLGIVKYLLTSFAQ